MQLIFVVEASKESKSDFYYISETLKEFYDILGHKITDALALKRTELKNHVLIKYLLKDLFLYFLVSFLFFFMIFFVNQILLTVEDLLLKML